MQLYIHRDIGIVLVLQVEYINNFDDIHMSLVLDIFTRRRKSYRHVDGFYIAGVALTPSVTSVELSLL